MNFEFEVIADDETQERIARWNELLGKLDGKSVSDRIEFETLTFVLASHMNGYYQYHQKQSAPQPTGN